MKLPPKRRQGKGPRPPGGGKFRTQRGVTGSESRARSPAPQSSNQVPGRRASGGWQLLRRGRGVGSREERWPSTPRPLYLNPVLAWLKREEEEDTPVGTSGLPAVEQGAAGIWGRALGQVGEDIGS